MNFIKLVTLSLLLLLLSNTSRTSRIPQWKSRSQLGSSKKLKEKGGTVAKSSSSPYAKEYYPSFIHGDEPDFPSFESVSKNRKPSIHFSSAKKNFPATAHLDYTRGR